MTQTDDKRLAEIRARVENLRDSDHWHMPKGKQVAVIQNESLLELSRLLHEEIPWLCDQLDALRQERQRLYGLWINAESNVTDLHARVTELEAALRTIEGLLPKCD